MARPRLELTQEQLEKIETMAGLGLTNQQMASLLDMSKKTFERRMQDTVGGSDALLKGRAKASSQVLKSAFQQATSGKNPTMTIFWLKCREGWKDTSVVEHTGKDGAPLFSNKEFSDYVKQLKKG